VAHADRQKQEQEPEQEQEQERCLLPVCAESLEWVLDLLVQSNRESINRNCWFGSCGARRRAVGDGARANLPRFSDRQARPATPSATVEYLLYKGSGHTSVQIFATVSATATITIGVEGKHERHAEVFPSPLVLLDYSIVVLHCISRVKSVCKQQVRAERLGFSR